jgi:hypothetical protein
MDFRLEFTPPRLPEMIRHQHKLLLIGSCFTENIGIKLRQHKFKVLENPNGILFNPVSIAGAIQSYTTPRQYDKSDLFYQNECWNSWQHHSRFSHPDREACITRINQSQEEAHAFIQQADWVFITLGSAFVYELEDKQVVANCHKVPTDKFHKRLLDIQEVKAVLDSMLQHISLANPSARVIFTISPVRHLRDGFVENNRSKSALIQAVHQTVNWKNTFYFPAYELVIDDLRDYRFYAEDMVHPNYAATAYVWEKFLSSCVDEDTQKLMKEINTIVAARNHKPFNPGSALHKKFLESNLNKIKQLLRQYPYIDFDEETRYFQSSQ